MYYCHRGKHQRLPLAWMIPKRFLRSMCSTPSRFRRMGREIIRIIPKTVFGSIQRFPRMRVNGTAPLHLFSIEKPLWVYANVSYHLKKPISGAGYYYGIYSTNQFALSSLMEVATAADLKKADIVTTLKPKSFD